MKHHTTSLDGNCTAHYRRADGTALRCIRKEGHDNWHQSSGDVHVWISYEWSFDKPIAWMDDQRRWFVTFRADDGLFENRIAYSRTDAYRLARKVAGK